jgi:HK97 family phage portal protein
MKNFTFGDYKMSFLSNIWDSFKKSLKNLRLASSRTKLYVGSVPWGSTQKVESDHGADQETYKRIFRNEPFVRGPVGAIVDTCIKSGWDFVPRFPDTENLEGRIKTIKQFFYHPELQFPVFLRNLITNLVVYDDVYVEIAKDENGGKNIFVLDTEQCKIKRDTHGEIESVIHREGDAEAQSDFKPEEIVWITMNRMGSAFYGMSDLETVVQPADLHRSAFGYNKKFFENAGIPTLAYLVKDASDPQMKSIEKKLKEIRVGDNILLGGDITIEPLSVSSKDMEYAELLSSTRKEMMAVIRVPSVAIGYETKTSLEGARVQLNTFGFRINGIQQIVENAIDRIILRLFGENYVDIRFELNEWVDPYVQAQIDAIHSKWGAIVPNEIRKRLGYKPLPDGDKPYVPITGMRPETNEDGMGPDTNLNEQQSERQDRDKETPGK